MGVDKDGDLCGDPVTRYKKPNVGKTYPIQNPVESDEFNEPVLGKQWQWHANYNPKFSQLLTVSTGYTPTSSAKTS